MFDLAAIMIYLFSFQSLILIDANRNSQNYKDFLRTSLEQDENLVDNIYVLFRPSYQFNCTGSRYRSIDWLLLTKRVCHLYTHDVISIH